MSQLQNATFQHLNLHPAITKAIAVCGYTKPTPVQAQSIPATLTGQDVVACAQTGSGKTAAFVLPALHRLSADPSPKKTRVLILTPTRELATQISKAAMLYGKFLRFSIVNLVGGMPYGNQIKDLARGADIIVATPGRLLDHIEQRRVNLSGIEMLVLDEADRMLDMGFIEDVQYIAKLTPASRQTLLFSATLDKEIAGVVRQLLNNPLRIDLSTEKASIPQIKQELYRVNSPQQKNHLLRHFLQAENIYKAIIFSATKINADKLANQLCADGFAAAALHGDLRQNVRNRTIDQLRRGKIQYLVATDVAARGIDIPDITHVINYDLPRFCEDYVHRIGRTGRAGRTGTAISFMMPTDRRHLQGIERFIGKSLPVMQINVDGASTTKTEVTEPAPFKEKIKEKHNSYRGKKKSSSEKPYRRQGKAVAARSIKPNTKTAPKYRAQQTDVKNKDRNATPFAHARPPKHRAQQTDVKNKDRNATPFAHTRPPKHRAQQTDTKNKDRNATPFAHARPPKKSKRFFQQHRKKDH